MNDEFRILERMKRNAIIRIEENILNRGKLMIERYQIEESGDYIYTFNGEVYDDESVIAFKNNSLVIVTSRWKIDQKFLMDDLPHDFFTIVTPGGMTWAKDDELEFFDGSK